MNFVQYFSTIFLRNDLSKYFTLKFVLDLHGKLKVFVSNTVTICKQDSPVFEWSFFGHNLNWMMQTIWKLDQKYNVKIEKTI
jgi:hypothetical protein